MFRHRVIKVALSPTTVIGKFLIVAPVSPGIPLHSVPYFCSIAFSSAKAALGEAISRQTHEHFVMKQIRQYIYRTPKS